MTVDASELKDLLSDPGIGWTAHPTNPDRYLVSLFGRDGLSENSIGRALGDFTVERQKDGSFRILNDKYDFDQKKSNWSVRAEARNYATFAGSRIVGTGVPFVIQFTGTFRPPVDPTILVR